MNDAAEESYWRFDARRKGYGEWKQTPQSERDAYKAEYSALRAYVVEATVLAEHRLKSLATLHAQLAEVTRERDIARRGTAAVAALMDESEGVSGLHMNGDLAPWSELRTGGRFEEWLIDFDAALEQP